MIEIVNSQKYSFKTSLTRDIIEGGKEIEGVAPSIDGFARERAIA